MRLHGKREHGNEWPLTRGLLVRGCQLLAVIGDRVFRNRVQPVPSRLRLRAAAAAAAKYSQHRSAAAVATAAAQHAAARRRERPYYTQSPPQALPPSAARRWSLRQAAGTSPVAQLSASRIERTPWRCAAAARCCMKLLKQTSTGTVSIDTAMVDLSNLDL